MRRASSRVLWTLAMLTCAQQLLAGEHHARYFTHERLIGWKGEVHSVEASIGKPIERDDRQGCSTVNVGRERSYIPQHSSNQWLYTYPREKDRPHYTHMAMITQLPNGTLLAAWQAGDHSEGASDQHLQWCYSLDAEGDEWSAPQKLDVVGDGRHAIWGPTFLVDTQRGVLWLFYSESVGACRGSVMEWAPGGSIKGVRYNLHTQSWGTPQMIHSLEADDGIPKVTANKAIELSSGEFVMPFWRERALLARTGKACRRLAGKQSAGVLISEDRGATWKAYGSLSMKGSWLIENALVELGSGQLMMVFRTRVGRIFAMYSEDKGRTWSEASPLADLKNPNAKVDMTRLLPNGELAIVYNDHVNPLDDKSLQAQGCTKCRTFLRVAISYDEGINWRHIAYLEEEVGHSLRMHYPTLQQVGCNLKVVWSRYYTKHIKWSDTNFEGQGIRLATVKLSDGSEAAAAGFDAERRRVTARR